MALLGRSFKTEQPLALRDGISREKMESMREERQSLPTKPPGPVAPQTFSPIAVKMPPTSCQVPMAPYLIGRLSVNASSKENAHISEVPLTEYARYCFHKNQHAARNGRYLTALLPPERSILICPRHILPVHRQHHNRKLCMLEEPSRPSGTWHVCSRRANCLSIISFTIRCHTCQQKICPLKPERISFRIKLG